MNNDQGPNNPPLNPVTISSEPVPQATPIVPKLRRGRLLLLILLVVAGLGGIGGFSLWRLRQPAPEAPRNKVTDTKVQEVDLGSISPKASSFSVTDGDKVVVNGQLQATQSIILAPSGPPDEAVAGQIYLDELTNQLLYFDGTNFVTLGSSVTNIFNQTGVASLQGQTGALSLTGGGGISISSTTVSTDGTVARLNGSGDNQIFTGVSQIFRNNTNSTTALQVQNAASQSILTVDTSNGQLQLGQSGSLSGKLVVANATNSNTVTVQTATATANRTITLPDADGTICLSTNNCGFAGGTTAFVQDGNSFGTTATLGTNDGNSLVLETSGTPRLTITSAGATRLDGTLEVQSTASIGNQASLVPNALLYAKHSFASGVDCANLGGCYGLVSDLTLNNPTNPGVGTALYGKVTTAAASFTLSTAHGLYIDSASAGAGSTITSNYGIRVQSQTAGTNDYGIYIQGADTYALWVDSGATRLDGTLEVQTLGTADTQTTLCRNSTNQIATCSGVVGSPIIQGGNTFGAAMRIGTNDSNSIEFETGNTHQLTLTTAGNLEFTSGANRTLSVATQTAANTAGNNLTVQAATGNGFGAGGKLTLQGGTGGSGDGSGGNVEIFGGLPGSTGNGVNGGSVTIKGANVTNVSDAGSVTIESGGQANKTGAKLTLSGASGFGNVVGIATLEGGSGTAGSSHGGAVNIKGGGGGTAANTNGGDIVIQGGTKNGSGTTGIVMVKSRASNNTTTAFQVRDASDNVALNVDTTNLRVGIGRNNPGARLDIDDSTSSSDVDILRVISDVGGANNVKFNVDSDGDVVTDGLLFVGTLLWLGSQTTTITDDGIANDTLTVTNSVVRVQIDETANAGVPVLAINELGAFNIGTIVYIWNEETDGSHDTFTIDDSAGVIELPGSATVTMGPNDVLTLVYTGDRWVTVSYSDN